jgi:hypothetical protein
MYTEDSYGDLLLEVGASSSVKGNEINFLIMGTRDVTDSPEVIVSYSIPDDLSLFACWC